MIVSVTDTFYCIGRRGLEALTWSHRNIDNDMNL